MTPPRHVVCCIRPPLRAPLPSPLLRSPPAGRRAVAERRRPSASERIGQLDGSCDDTPKAMGRRGASRARRSARPIANGGLRCYYAPHRCGDLNYRKNAPSASAHRHQPRSPLTTGPRAAYIVRGSGLYEWKVMDDTTSHVQFTHDRPRA